MHHAAGLTAAHPIWDEMVPQVHVQQGSLFLLDISILSSKMAAIYPLGFMQDLVTEEEMI